MLKTRVKTAAVLILIAAALLCASGVPYVMASAAALLGAAAAWEVFGVCGKDRRSAGFLLALLFALVWPYVPVSRYDIALAVLLPAGILFFAVESGDLERFSVFGAHSALPLSLLTTVLFKSFPELRALDHGLILLLLPVVVCVATDTAAYFTGRAMGKRKLCPRISPGKTVEGALGGVISAVVVAFVYCLAAASAAGITLRSGAVLLFSLTASVLSQAGDLSFSVVKRIAGVKDYGNLMPGHGGILDRFDSMLFTVPYMLIFTGICPVFVF